MSRSQRIGLLVLAVAVLVVGFVIAHGSGDDGKSKPATSSAATPSGGAATTAKPAAPQIPAVVVVGAKPQGGIRTITVNKGDQIRFKVRSDTADEIHVHGYDFHKDVPAGGTASFSFPAKIDGKFVVELENHAQQIASLVVEP